MPMCQLAKKASRQPPQAAGEEGDASLDSTGRRADAMELMVSEAGLRYAGSRGAQSVGKKSKGE